MMQVLETDRLILRPMCVDDAEWVTRGIRVPEVIQWLTSPPYPFQVQDARDFIGQHDGSLRYVAVIHNQQPLGAIGLDAGAKGYELGYWLKTSAHGQGFMTEAATAVIDWHFAQTGDAIGSGWIKGNAASANVLTKLGFSKTQQVRRWANYHGKEMPLQRCLLTAQQWEAQRG